MKIPQINQKYLYDDIYAIIQTDDGTDVSLHNKMQLCFILYMNLKYTTQKKITVCFFSIQIAVLVSNDAKVYSWIKKTDELCEMNMRKCTE